MAGALWCVEVLEPPLGGGRISEEDDVVRNSAFSFTGHLENVPGCPVLVAS